MERYKARFLKSGVTSKTVNNHLSILRKCLVTAYEWLELDGSPPKVAWLKNSQPVTRYLTEEEGALTSQI